MKYIVMECHYSYAVVLDEHGRFIKAANMHYEVGQTVTDIFEMKEPEHAPLNIENETQPVNVTGKKKSRRWLSHFAAMAACMVLIFTVLFQVDHSAYGSVFVTINPEIRIDVNKKDIVIGITGVNEDGKDLIKGYSYKRKNLDLVMDELVDLAIEKQYLAEGGQISLSFSGEHKDWITAHKTHLNEHLNEYLNEKMTITIEIDDDEVEVSVGNDTEEKNTSSAKKDTESTNSTVASESDYDKDSSYGASNYDDSKDDAKDSPYDNSNDEEDSNDDRDSDVDDDDRDSDNDDLEDDEDESDDD